MHTFVSILRGVNVGQKQVRMEALRKLYEELSFRNVTSYVQSGNVVFRDAATDTDVLEKKIFSGIRKSFGFEVPVLVLSEATLAEVIRKNPLVDRPGIDPRFLHVTFLAGPPADGQDSVIREKAQGEEEIFITDRAVYLYCPHGYGTTKLHNSFLETKLKVEATTRNWRTTTELLRIAGEISAAAEAH